MIALLLYSFLLYWAVILLIRAQTSESPIATAQYIIAFLLILISYYCLWRSNAG